MGGGINDAQAAGLLTETVHADADDDGDGSRSEEDPGGEVRGSNGLEVGWREDVMGEWGREYAKARGACVDEVGGIALGRTGDGGTVLANSRLGYWDLIARKKAPGGGHSLRSPMDAERSDKLYVVME